MSSFSRATRRRLWSSLSNFIKDTGFGSAAWYPAVAATPPEPAPVPGASEADRDAASGVGQDRNLGADPIAMTDGRTALVYLVDRRYEYPHGHGVAEPQPCETTLTLKGLAEGAYEVTWSDPETGTVTGSASAECHGGKLELASPSFHVDAAVRIVPAKKP